MTRFVGGFAAGFALCFASFFYLDSLTWRSALASFSCGQFGRVNVFLNVDDGSVCVDMSDAYSSSYAIDLIVGRISRRQEGPR